VILADTSIWIEFFRRQDPSIDEQMTEHLTAGLVFGISVVFGELLQGVRDEREEKIVLEFWKNLPQVEERNLFIDAGRLSFLHKLYSKGIGLIDCYILAASKRHHLEIWSLDKKLLHAVKLLE
jgi:predicted nucleic acid-binding protein